MAPRGRPALPAGLRTDGVTDPAVGKPALDLAAPAYFTPLQRGVWLELMDFIVPGVLQTSDSFALEALAVAIAQFRAASTALKAPPAKGGGLTVYSPNGYRIANPLIALRDQASKEIRAWAARFGLTPSDRVSLGLGLIKANKAAGALEQSLPANPRNRADGDDF